LNFAESYFNDRFDIGLKLRARCSHEEFHLTTRYSGTGTPS
jgi:hypothetical protein